MFISATSTQSKTTTAAGDHTTSLTKQETLKQVLFCLKQNSLLSPSSLLQSGTVVSLCLTYTPTFGPCGPGGPSGPGKPLWPGGPGTPGKPFSPCKHENKEVLKISMNSPVYRLFLKHLLLSVPPEFYIRVCYCGRYTTLAHTDLFLCSCLCVVQATWYH